MAESVPMEVQPRQGRGSHRAEKLRRQGLIPAVVYANQSPRGSPSTSPHLWRMPRALRGHVLIQKIT